MKATIDKAGRVVIPIDLRRKAGFQAGDELELTLADDGSVQIRSAVTGPKLVCRDGRWTAEPTIPIEDLPKLDLAEHMEEMRERDLQSLIDSILER